MIGPSIRLREARRDLAARIAAESSVIPVIVGATVLAVLTGILAGLGGGLYVVLLAVGLAAVALAIFDYRIGIWLLVLLLPFSATTFLPRQMFGIQGFSPFNILFVFTVVTILLASLLSRTKTVSFPRIPAILWVYTGAFIASAIFGSFFAHKGIAALLTSTVEGNLNARTYLQIVLVKPLLILFVAYFAGMLAKTDRGAIGVFWSIVFALTLMVLAELAGIVMSGFSLSILASSHSRGFLNWTGLHANQIGLFLTMGFSLLLFASQGDERKFRAFVLFCLACAAAIGAALTFSRATFLGLLLVGGYFLVSRKKIGTALVGFLGVLIIALGLPDAFIERATTGITHGSSDNLSAGRINNIWLPLLPEILDSPLVGHGQRFIIWSAQALRGEIVGGVGHAHSAYLETLLNMGLAGLVLVGLTFRFMWKIFREMKDRHPVGLWRGYFEGASICVLVLLVMGLTGEEFVPAVPQTYLWISLGMALGFRETLKGEAAGQQESSRLKRTTK